MDLMERHMYIEYVSCKSLCKTALVIARECGANGLSAHRVLLGTQ